MVKARTLGRDAAFVARRQIPALFSLTTPVRNPRTLTIEGLAVRISAGPRRSCCGFRVRPARLSEAVPRALPAFVVHPQPGAAIADRPWGRSGFVDQTPLCRWAEPGETEDTACRPARSIPGDQRLNSHAATMPKIERRRLREDDWQQAAAPGRPPESAREPSTR
jgi:hypothetical protein